MPFGNSRCRGLPISRHELFCPHTAIDLKNGGGSLQKGPYGGKVDVTFTVADEDFMEVVQGRLNPQKVQKLLTGRMGWFSCLIPIQKCSVQLINRCYLLCLYRRLRHVDMYRIPGPWSAAY